MLSQERAREIITAVADSSLSQIQSICHFSYPHEACGIIFDDGTIQPARNVIHELGHPGLTSKNSFMIDGESWSRAFSSGKKVSGIYHSHNNGDPNMSPTDLYTLDVPDLVYLVVGVIDHNPVAAKVHWWENGIIQSIDVELNP